MRTFTSLIILFVALLVPHFAAAEGENGCDPQYRALAENALVEFKGTGDLDILVVTDPLCWHCRLGHKLLKEYPNLYRSVKLSFFPRRSFMGSDMAAWILEDAADSPLLKQKVDFAYENLKQPKTQDLAEARMVVLQQFLIFFPDMLEGTNIDALYARLEHDHQQHVLESSALGNALKLPGTPVLVAGKKVLLGYGAGPWIKALEEKAFCK
ncbi:DsbA family protein [Pseudodesulfovibrio piezophilus]|uniref:Thioredoxin-like fold domain-containing protein n=1 Tax=Pseudodesulfovibrio piezophilus (strain DSM 21447 / JCM 15486 / C1TLV30) TaxID=1322246 RepID=M1WLQ4_PSEP2|nr:hypothetical protein [Pseudodesulfovibrio piezophilus]CCH48265.1 conserved exported protein of unknown function [Pseudodesulfovibrio piezophilus C1TLV30]